MKVLKEVALGSYISNAPFRFVFVVQGIIKMGSRYVENCVKNREVLVNMGQMVM